MAEQSETLADNPFQDRFGGRRPTSHEQMTGVPWDASYVGGPAPWEIGRPQPAIMRVASDGDSPERCWMRVAGLAKILFSLLRWDCQWSEWMFLRPRWRWLAGRLANADSRLNSP